MRRLAIVACLVLQSSQPGNAAEKTLLPANHDPVVVVLDASGSMAAALGKETRLDAARRILLDTLSLFPPDRPVALVAYGHRRKSDCRDIETLRPLGPVDIAAIRQSLAPLRARGKTPLSGALRHAAGLLPEGGGTIMLVSDGLETCAEDPCAVAAALTRAHAGLIIHVVGFGLARGEMKGLACIAEQGGGRAIETSNAKGLEQALKRLTDEPAAGDGKGGEKSAAEPQQRPAEPPPPVAKPVTLKAVVGDQAVPGPVLFTVVNGKGETVYSGKGKELAPSLVPGRYEVRVAAGNVETVTKLTVTGEPEESHEIPLKAGLVRLSLVAAKGLALADTDIKGDPDWTLVPQDGQAPTTVDAVLAPDVMLAPGRYEAVAAIGEYKAATTLKVTAGMTLQAELDLRLGKVTLEAALPGATDEPGSGAVLESGTGLSWSLASREPGMPDRNAEAAPRPTFLVPAGHYTARLSIAGAVIEKPVTAEAGATTTVRLDLPSTELVLEGSLGPGAPAFTDWRDASWTVRPLALIGNAKAGPALEDKAEAAPRLSLLPGEWEVTLISGQARVVRTMTLAPGTKRQERMELSAARLSVSASPEAGAPPPVNVLISVFEAKADGGVEEKPVAEIGTQRDHAFILPAGRYRIDASDEKGRKGTTTVELMQGQSVETGILLK